MRPNLFISRLMVLMLSATCGNAAVAACSAGNANGSVAESTPDADFDVDAANGTVIHRKTGLMWKRCAEGLSDAACETSIPNGQATFDWEGALVAAIAANTASFAGYADWRLPNKKELESIAEPCGYLPAINRNAFLGTPRNNFFWSATTYLRDPTQAWMATSGNGATGFDSKSNFHYVRLVRGGQGPDSFDSLQRDRSNIGHIPRFTSSQVNN